MRPEKVAESCGESVRTQAAPETLPALPELRDLPAAPRTERKNSDTRRWFTYDGRTFRLEMRKESPFWTLSFEDKGATVKHSTKTTDGKVAEKNARIFLAARREKDNAVLKHIISRKDAPLAFSRLDEIFKVVPGLEIDAKDLARVAYVAATRWVLKFALELETDDEVGKLSSQILNSDTARLYFAKVTRHAATLDPAKGETFKRTAERYFDCSMALFAPRAVWSMRKTFKLLLPDMSGDEGWRQGKMHAPATTKNSEFLAPPNAVVQRTLVEWVKMARTPGYRVPTCEGEAHGDPMTEIDRRNTFIAVGLALSFGLRKGDMKRICWNWFDRDESGPVLRVGGVTQKNRQSSIEVSAVDPFWKILNFWVDKNGWRGRPEETCLIAREQTARNHHALKYVTGGPSDATFWPFWLVGRWLRWLGWTTQKTNHALRDLVASKLTMKYKLETVSMWCRHSSITTTQEHYNRFITRREQLNPKKLAWLRWAK